MNWEQRKIIAGINAQNAVKNYKSKIGGSKEWFQKVLDILKNGKYARVQLYTKYPFTYDEYNKKDEFVEFVDIQAVANTDSYASFFDIFNHEYLINFNFEPVAVEKLEYRLGSFYNKYHKQNEEVLF